MSEDVIRPRPVVDTALPEELREEILRESAPAPSPRHARPDAEPLSRALRLGEAGIQLLGVGLTLLVAMVMVGWYLGMVVASISVVAYVTALTLRREANPAVRLFGALFGGATVAAAPLWMFDLLPASPPAGAPWLLFAVLIGTVTADTLTVQDRQSPVERYRDRLLLPGDLSAADHGLLVKVQQTIDRVTDARAELGAAEPGCADALDTARGLAVLREQEWRIASLLFRQRELRREYLRRWQQASSARVREVLEPQRVHLQATEDHIRRRVVQIEEYGRLVDSAVLAHREWEQCQEVLDSMGDYADLRAEASLLSARSPEVAELAGTAEAARCIRDESVAKVRAAVRDLTAVPGA